MDGKNGNFDDQAFTNLNKHLLSNQLSIDGTHQVKFNSEDVVSLPMHEMSLKRDSSHQSQQQSQKNKLSLLTSGEKISAVARTRTDKEEALICSTLAKNTT